MKTKIVIAAILLINFFNCNLIKYTYCQQNWTSVFETINIPNTTLAGINPEDIIYSNNKFFVWGLGAIIIIDADDLTISNTLILSNSTQYDYHSIIPILSDPPHSKMAYNGINRIYALSPDNVIFIIDTESGSFINSVIEKPENVPDYFFENSIVRYDSKNNRLLWCISWIEQQISHVHLEYFDLENEDPELIWFKDRQYTYVKDIVFNKLSNYFYLSCENNKIEICPSNYGIFHVEETIITTGPNSDFLYISPTEENELHRIYCLSFNKIYWIDGEDNSSSSIASEAIDLKCIAYNPQVNKLYVSGNAYAYIYNASEPPGSLHTISLDINRNNEKTHYMEYFHDRVYACKPNEIVTITAENSVSNLIQKENNYFYSAAYDPFQQKILFCNTIGGAVEIVDAPQNYIGNQIITGVSVFKSLFNPQDRKAYFYSDNLQNDCKLVVMHYVENAYQIEEILPFTNNISSCGYNLNPSSHHILVSSYSSTNEIIKLNAETNESVGILNIDNEYCENIFITPEPNNRIFCATGMNSLLTATLEVFNSSDYSEDISIPLLGNDNELIDYRMKFCYDNLHDFVFFILFKRNYNPSDQWGFLGKIDINNEENPLTLVELDYSPEKIVYAETFNRIFIKNSNSRYYTSFDCNNLDDPILDEYPVGTIIMDIEYANSDQYSALYILGSNGICQAYTPEVSLPEHQYELPFWVISMMWNPIDNKLYVYSPYDYYRNHISWIYKIDPSTAQIYEYQLPNNSIWRYEDYLHNNEMIVDPYSGRLLCPNGSHSNVSATPENIILNPLSTWNWISFPRLAYQGTPPQPELQKINHFPSELHLLNYPLQNEQSILKHYDYEEGEWSGDIQGLYSTYGYKLNTDNHFEAYFPISGDMLDPGTEITIYDGHENWVGYFLTETQSPFDAIPEEVLPHLKSIRAQYWSCLNYAFIAPPPKSTSASTGEWRCECNQGMLKMKYSDMVILTLGNTLEQTFAWNQSEGGGTIINKEAPEYFQFNEQADYEAIFIDLDSIDLPEEIGAFAGDSCIGASKVLPEDTTAMICAYTQGFEGEEISFELMYPTKALRPVIDDYLVFNNHTRIKERRKILIGEKQQFYLVSFNKNEDNPDETHTSWMHCLNNPVTNEATIAYSISGETRVKINLTNMQGMEMMKWDQGIQHEGEYALIFNTAMLPAGIYLVNAIAGNRTCTTKLLIVN